MSDCVATSYLGYPLTIGPDTVTVRTPDGRRLAAATSVKQARLIVKGYRRASKAAA